MPVPSARRWRALVRTRPAAFTLSRAPGELRHVVRTRSGTRPYMRFTRPTPGARFSARLSPFETAPRDLRLSVGWHVYGPRPCGPPLGPAFGSSNPLRADWCARASFGHPPAGLPLPSASRDIRPHRGLHRCSYRGLPPHQFMPMPGVHKSLVLTCVTLRFTPTAQFERYA